ncbi:hypothetical protein Sme01_09540 [Sphaerisporangium melleum]|uniref:Uncharacterized protein n=1 Tax=Sphaerisporangium melleum TaxID=321316 RepID=A0A917VEF1_9ACTN|nr:hypothetical protein [Sphaerisporangium melleum]GGK67427.1 hypothetical protein GCM10007964_08070 [Sphaerisporangium melleum]GII68478.1 hypothetical protein Sme01_09540 [Sphaerisporangium melleum]
MVDTPKLHPSTRPGIPGPVEQDRRPGRRRLPGRPGRWRAPAARLAAPAFTLAATVGMLIVFGTPVADMALFGLYVVLALAVPGTLLVRALYRGTRTRAEEVALGLALGYAVEVLTYLPARALGVPRLVLIWPVATYLAFLAIPALRRHWKSAARVRAPLWWSWCLALTFVFLLCWSGIPYFRNNALTWPLLGAGGHDVGMHLALVVELKHHFPPQFPMTAGEPLLYHWFVYAHMAAASWLTGIEPLVMLSRLAMLPMLAALLVLVGMASRRVMGTWRGAPAVVFGTVLVSSPSLYLSPTMVLGWGSLQGTAWRGPAQTFGGLLFAALMIPLLEVLTHRAPRRLGPWLLIGVLMVTIMGGKAVYLPVLLAGTVAVILVRLYSGRRPLWPAVTVAAVCAACLVFAQTVLFGMARQGMLLMPWGTMQERWASLTGRPMTEAPFAQVLGLAVVFVLSLAVLWCGVVALLRDRRTAARPAVVFILGMALAGHAVTIVFTHPGYSNFLFSWAAYPYLVILAVHGTMRSLRRARVSARAAAFAAGGAVATVCVIAVGWGVTIPLPPGRSPAVLWLPYLTLAIVAGVAAVIMARTLGRARAAALMVTGCTAVALLACGYARVLWFPGKVAARGIELVGRGMDSELASVPAGTLDAARWLRAHSTPDDLVATNNHCRPGLDPCYPGQFLGAALTERRMLVEGWSTSQKTNDSWRPEQGFLHLPFWDPERLRDNDTAINRPTAAAVARLRDRYHVRWLLADRLLVVPGTDLGRFATLMYRSGDYDVYRIPDRSGG